MKTGFVVPLTTWFGVAVTEYVEVNLNGPCGHEPHFGAAETTEAQAAATATVVNFMLMLFGVLDVKW